MDTIHNSLLSNEAAHRWATSHSPSTKRSAESCRTSFEAHGTFATFKRPCQASRIPLATPGMSGYTGPHLTPTPVAYYGSEKCNDYSCVTFKSFVDNEIRKSTLPGRVLPIIPVSHVTSWLTRGYIKNIFRLPNLTIIPVSHITTREAERYGKSPRFRLFLCHT